MMATQGCTNSAVWSIHPDDHPYDVTYWCAEHIDVGTNEACREYAGPEPCCFLTFDTLPAIQEARIRAVLVESSETPTLPEPQPITIRSEWDDAGHPHPLNISGWPEVTCFSNALLSGADQQHLWRRGDRIHLSVDNGDAEYVITHEPDPDYPDCVRAARLYGVLR